MTEKREAELDLAFEAFHADNPGVYALFAYFTAEILQTGRKNYSARAVAHRIRWHSDIETNSPDGFKLNNNHVRRYALKFMDDYPEHRGFFRTRTPAA